MNTSLSRHTWIATASVTLALAFLLGLGRARYSSAKGCRSYISADVVTAVHICMDHLSISRSIPTACHPFPAKRRWLRSFWIVGAHGMHNEM